jgi:hypothetical protein
VSLCVICVSTKCCSTTSSMNIVSIDVAIGLVCFLACQCLLLLCKNSTTNLPIVFIS